MSSPFVKIEVINPHYERIRVICKVKFKGLLNPKNYISRLNRDLIEYLTPWIGSSELDEQFGNSFYRSKTMSFVSQRSYVEFITSFSIVKTETTTGSFNIIDTANKEDAEVILPEFPWSILTSVEQHDISAIDHQTFQKPVPRGIGNIKLGVDFGIINEHDQ